MLLCTLYRLSLIISGFVVENFTKDKLILIKTRRIYSYSKLCKSHYVYLSVLKLLNLDVSRAYTFSMYAKHVTKELLRNIWRFYLKNVPKNLGLVISNHHKSATHKLVSAPNPLKSITSFSVGPKYLVTYEVYQFFVTQALLKKLIMYYMSILSQQHVTYSISFNLYTGYVWLNKYIKLNPANNAFYLKIYNY